MSGWIAIAGLGPGDAALVTPEVTAALAEASDVIGYIPYVARVAPRAGLALHPSDNRVELDRARHAIDLALAGHRVVVVSSGDPGVFAMAAAVFEAIDHGPPAWRSVDVRVLPGITAMLAAAARADATARFSPARFAKDIAALYGQALRQPARAALADVPSPAGWESVE